MAEDTPDKKFAYKYLFDVQARGIQGGFSKVSGISEEIEVVDMRDGSDPFQIRKIKGARQGGLLTLERGVVRGRAHLMEWFLDVKKGKTPYWENVDINMFASSQDLVDGIDAFSARAYNAWPNKYELGDLDAKTSEVVVEVLSIVHEGIGYG